MDFKTAFKVLISEKGITITEVAAKAGVSQSYLSQRLAAGEFSPKFAPKVAEALGMDLEAFQNLMKDKQKAYDTTYNSSNNNNVNNDFEEFTRHGEPLPEEARIDPMFIRPNTMFDTQQYLSENDIDFEAVKKIKMFAYLTIYNEKFIFDNQLLEFLTAIKAAKFQGKFQKSTAFIYVEFTDELLLGEPMKYVATSFTFTCKVVERIEKYILKSKGNTDSDK